MAEDASDIETRSYSLSSSSGSSSDDISMEIGSNKNREKGDLNGSTKERKKRVSFINYPYSQSRSQDAQSAARRVICWLNAALVMIVIISSVPTRSLPKTPTRRLWLKVGYAQIVYVCCSTYSQLFSERILLWCVLKNWAYRQQSLEVLLALRCLFPPGLSRALWGCCTRKLRTRREKGKERRKGFNEQW